MIDIAIAERGEAEAAQLFALARSAFGDRPSWDDRRVLDVLLRDLLFIAREGGSVAGYAALSPRRETVVVEQLLVATGHERRGVGRRLLAHAEGYAIGRRAKSLQIVVEGDNRPARAFYRRVGFTPVGGDVFELLLPRPA